MRVAVLAPALLTRTIRSKPFHSSSAVSCRAKSTERDDSPAVPLSMNELLAQCERDEASSTGGKASINEVASLRASLKELYDKRARAERNVKIWLETVQMKEGVYLPG